MGLPAYKKSKQEAKQNDALKWAMLNMQNLKSPSSITNGLAVLPIVDKYKIVSNRCTYDDIDEFDFL